MEPRVLLAVGVSTSYNARTDVITLNVRGNAATDIEVEMLNGVVSFTTDSTVRESAPWQTIRGIVVKADMGVQHVIVDQSVDVKTTIKTGRDADTVTSFTDAPVVIYTGSGYNSVLCFGSGPATVYGGKHADKIEKCGTGTLIVKAGGGDDDITGGDGNEVIYCGAGNDTARGMGGNDKIYGQGGMDVIYCGAGFDYINGGCGQVDIYYVTPGEDTWVLDNNRRIHDIVNPYDPTAVTQPWTFNNGRLTVDWSDQPSGADIRATGPTTVEIDWNADTYTFADVQAFTFNGSPYPDAVNMALLAGPSDITGNGGADAVNVLNGHFGDSFNDYNPSVDSLTGDGGTVTTADEQYGITGWLLRGNTVTVTLSSYVDPLGRIPLDVTIDGVFRGTHLVWSNLRIESTSLANITVGSGVSAALADHFFSLSEVEVAGALNPLNC
ncbi:MAG: hypothetical protein PHX87_03270 [Candidatus Peribacteraceae bacterium]|nr:hypothetical protein [Candidatus Peribacteraceae bacterium]MDD5742428.1 hypothetical protein [Candidatus Peribacteraceae bacterium]